MKVLSYFLIILIPLVIILGNFQYLILNFKFYQGLYRKVGVYQTFDDPQIANFATNNLFGYFRGKNQLDHNFFSIQAQTHLADVKQILQFTSYLFYLSLVIVLTISIYLSIKKKYKLLITPFLITATVTFVTIILLTLGLTKAFDSLFVDLHKVLFTNQLWLFPADDNLIRLFPQQFFILFANSMATNISATSLAIALISGLLIKKVFR